MESGGEGGGQFLLQFQCDSITNLAWGGSGSKVANWYYNLNIAILAQVLFLIQERLVWSFLGGWILCFFLLSGRGIRKSGLGGLGRLGRHGGPVFITIWLGQ